MKEDFSNTRGDELGVGENENSFLIIYFF